MKKFSSPGESFPEDEKRQVVEFTRTLVRFEPRNITEDFRNPGDAEAEEEDLTLTIQHYIRIFLKHRWLILGIVVFISALGRLYGLMKTPLYMSTVTIQIDSEALKVVDGEASVSEGGSSRGADFQRTHYELLKSCAMAERIVSALQLQDDTAFLKPREISLIGWISNHDDCQAQ